VQPGVSEFLCARGAESLVHGGGRRLRRTTDAVGKAVSACYALVSVVSDPAAKLVLAEDRQEITTMQTDDPKQQVRIFAEWANNQPGQFNTWPLTTLHQMMFENARILALSRAAPPPPPVSCQELSAIRVPVCVLRGESTRKYFTIIAQQVHDCIPNSRLIVIPGSRHVGYIENPSAFNAALLAHLKGADAR